MSKTVKRVSKTVKGVRRVMMVGLVAMLGAKAEAHLLVKGGKAWYCSVCVGAQLTEDETQPVDSNIHTEAVAHTEAVEFRLTRIKVDLLCRHRPEVSTAPVDLVVRKEIDQGDHTYNSVLGDLRDYGNGPARVEVVAIVSDLPLRLLASDNSKKDLKCLDTSIPTDLLIRETSINITPLACDVMDSDLTSCIPVGNTFSKHGCRLPRRFHSRDEPPIGTLYVCP